MRGINHLPQFLGYAAVIGGLLRPVLISSADTVTAKDAPREPRKIPTRLTMPLTLKHLAPGVCVDLVVPALSVPNVPIGLQISQGGSRSESHVGKSVYDDHQGARSVIISSLNDLKGCLRITTEAEALEFVRLRTSFETWHAWPGMLHEVEILTPDQVKHIPDYGLHREAGMQRGLEQRPTGGMGVLPASELRSSQINYSPARVSRMADSFTVVRWLFWSKAGPGDWGPKGNSLRGIQRVREEIGQDGSYRRNVELELPARQLPKLWVQESFL